MILLNLLQFVEYTYIFKSQDLPPKMSNFSLKKWGGGWGVSIFLASMSTNHLREQHRNF
jgi:hypothetical protein